MAWFVLSLLFVIVFAHVPPLSMIEGPFKILRHTGGGHLVHVAKTFDGKKPLGFYDPFSVITYGLRSLLRKKVKEQKKRWDEPITLVRSVNYVPD